MTLKEEIIQESKRLGIDKIGFTTAEPFDSLKESLEEQKAAGHTSGFEHPNIDERLYPEMTFDQPKSIISIALAYPTRIHEEVPRDEKRGQFARASWGIDYHDILRDRLNRLIEFIQTRAEKWTKRRGMASSSASRHWGTDRCRCSTASWIRIYRPKRIVDHRRVRFICLSW
mgnify:CR=1 FL=1